MVARYQFMIFELSILYHGLLDIPRRECLMVLSEFLSPAGAVGPGTGDIATPPVCLSVCPSVRLSVTFSFRTVTQKRMAVCSRNFAGTCTKSLGCAV